MRKLFNRLAILYTQPQFIKAMYCVGCLLFVVIFAAHAQTGPSDPATTDPDAVPIDGGLSLLVAAGVGYGAKKIKERKNRTVKI